MLAVRDLLELHPEWVCVSHKVASAWTLAMPTGATYLSDAEFSEACAIAPPVCVLHHQLAKEELESQSGNESLWTSLETMCKHHHCQATIDAADTIYESHFARCRWRRRSGGARASCWWFGCPVECFLNIRVAHNFFVIFPLKHPGLGEI